MTAPMTQTDGPPTVLHLDDVSLSFGGNRVLSRIGFDVGEGDLLAIIGPNGAGKTSEIEVTRVESERGSKDPDVHELIYKGYAAMFGAATSGPPALQQAERYLTQALERDPENPRAQTGLAGYHVRMALRLFAADPIPHLATAEALLQQVIDRHPSSSEAHQFMGMVDITRGHADEAARSFERAIELNSSCAPCYAQLGRALLRMGRPAEGLEHIHYAMRLSPRDPLTPNWLAMAGGVELELEHYGKAIEYLDRARALDPGQPRFSLLLVAAHALAGNTIEARTRLEQLQKTLPHLTGEQLITRFFGKATGPELSRLSEGLRLALASPWESPRLPSRPVADPSTRPNSAMTAIAVLPFTTYGDTAGSIQLTADMLTDDLINSLSRAPLLRVISRQTTRSYQNKPIDIAAIGAELGVRYILEGTLRMQGDKPRVNVELIDPKTRLAVRAIRIERGSTELPAVQDEIIGRLARELSFDIFQVESDRAPKDPNVAELNFKGWAALLASGMSGMDGLKLGKGYFDEALARDPENGIARTGVGAYHAIVGALKLDADSEVHLREAEQILRQVVHEYPRNTTANFFLGVSFRAFGRFEDAIDCFERVLEISQSHAPAYAHLGEALVALGRAHEGIDHIRYALRLSPRDPSRSHWLRFAGQAELELNHHEQAVAYLRQSYALNSRQPGTLRSLAAALAVSGQTEDARRYAAEFRAVAPHLEEKGLQKRQPARETRQPELARGVGLAFVGSL
jgi:tetratricopeptide (TPR) repeat protein